MNQPEPIKYEVKSIGKTIVVENPKQLITEQGYPCLDGGKVKHNGKTVRCVVRYDNKPELAARVAEWKSEWEAYEAEKAAEFDRNVPGLKELEAAQDAAYNEQARYDAEFERMMDTGHSISPKAVDETLSEKAAELAEQYPRAALYLRAKGYTYASNYHKSGAGKSAMEFISAGGSLDDAKEILENWVPESAMWN